jgi:hypothetical protein
MNRPHQTSLLQVAHSSYLSHFSILMLTLKQYRTLQNSCRSLRTTCLRTTAQDLMSSPGPSKRASQASLSRAVLNLSEMYTRPQSQGWYTLRSLPPTTKSQPCALQIQDLFRASILAGRCPRTARRIRIASHRFQDFFGNVSTVLQ